jgi:hypothetical protein
MGNKIEEQLLDFFPYPIAIFTPQYALTMTNKAFVSEIKTQGMELENGAIRILKHKIDDVRLAAAVTRVFGGDTFFLEDLKNPFSMFSGLAHQSASQPVHYNKAVIFSVSAGDAEITYGVIVFMP